VVSSAFLNSSRVNPYLYSGKEIDRMNGLNESDFSARWQDPAVPGFTSADPLAETHPWESPYSYCGANPVNRVDPTGMEWYWNDGEYPVWIDGCDDVDGYEYHNTDCYVTGLYGQNGYCYIHYTMGDDDNSNQDLLMLLQSARNGTGPNDGAPMFQNWHINQYPPGYGQPVVQKSAPVNTDQKLGDQKSVATNVEYGANGANSVTNSAANALADDLAKEYLKGGSRATLREIASAGESLDKVAKVTGVLGRVFGVASAIEHLNKLSEDLDNGDKIGVAINASKLVLDGVFFFAKSTDPVFLGAAIVYGAVDYMTNDHQTNMKNMKILKFYAYIFFRLKKYYELWQAIISFVAIIAFNLLSLLFLYSSLTHSDVKNLFFVENNDYFQQRFYIIIVDLVPLFLILYMSPL